MQRFRAAAKKANTKHGLSHTAPEYTIWIDMRRRCHQPQRPDYHNYGGRGITVCDRWRNDFAAFYRDMGPRPSGYSLERRDNNGPYSPSNCFWAPQKAQDGNKRTNRYIRLGAEVMTVAAAERQLGARRNFLGQRLRKGWLPERAMTEPSRAEPRTHCQHGHILTDENVAVGRDGKRRCRICRNARARAYRTQKRRPASR